MQEKVISQLNQVFFCPSEHISVPELNAYFLAAGLQSYDVNHNKMHHNEHALPERRLRLMLSFLKHLLLE